MAYTDSEFNPKLIKSQGSKVVTGPTTKLNDYVFIDPNPNQEIVPHEDLFIYVDLKAEARPKSFLLEKETQVFKISNTIGNSVSLTTPQKAVVVDGNKLFKNVENLTTSWTEIGGLNSNTEKTGFDTEGFNITNIDINIKSQVAPTVVIDFIDVRGATLFEQGSCSPYGFFFQLPYPVFQLTVKGYYGKAATYHLNLIKFNAKFNSDTGNMECRAEFVGYSFAFLSDVLIGYVYAAGFLDEVSTKYGFNGKLQKIYDKTVKFYNSPAGGNLGVTNNFCSGPNGCLKIPDLLKSLNTFDKTDKEKIINSPEYQEVVRLKDLLKKYNSYREIVENLVKDFINTYTKQKTTSTGNNKNRELKIVYGNSTAGAQIVKKELDPGQKLNANFNLTNGGIFLTTIKDIMTTKVGESFPYQLTGNEIKCLLKTPNQFEDTTITSYKIYDSNDIATKPWFGGSGGLDTLGYQSSDVASTTYYIDFGYILDNIDIEIKSLEDLIKKKTETVSKRIDELIGQSLGFQPTIRNVFTIFLANTEALMEVLKGVSVAAERYHKTESLNLYKDPNNSEKVENSNNNYVYSWPTYSVEETSSNGEAEYEKYPGEKVDFRDWPEVLFVEDFARAFLKLQQFEDVLNQNFEGKPGYDNYAPINPLESRAWFNTTPNKYSTVVGKPELLKVIGERLFIALDHSLFQPIRLTKDAELIGWGKNAGIGRGKWNPLKKDNVITSIAGLDSWNLLNSSEDKKLLEAVLTGLDETTFIDAIKNSLTGLKELKGLNIFRTGVPGSDDTGWKQADDYYVYMTDPTNGIEIKKNDSGGSVWVHPNPFKMDTSNLIKILDPTETVNLTKINLSNENFKNFLNNTYKIGLETSVSDIDFKTTDYNPEIDVTDFEETQQMISYQKQQLFTTLAMSYDGSSKDDTWWTSGVDVTQQAEDKIGGSIVSNMGMMTYWDDSGINGVLGVHLIPATNNAKIPSSNSDKSTYDVNLRALSWPLITTPMWLDNVINFRKLKSSASDVNKNYDESTQYKNLAYLFLHTLKPTPFVQRIISDDGFMFYNSGGKIEPADYGPSLIWSLRAFNTIGGIAKVPKAWLLTLGAQLWRWREFTGSKKGEKWKKPLICIGCKTYDIPNGNDPLIQPGYNSIDGSPRTPSSFRNDPINYLLDIYGSGSYNLKIPKSVFNGDTEQVKTGNAEINDGTTLLGGNDYLFFDYYAFYKDKLKELKPLIEYSTYVENKTTTSWPQLYIAPHHIPYVVSDRFNDGDNGEGANFVFITDNWIGYQDYQTIMPLKVTRSPYNEENGNPSKINYTHRSKLEDGNLGMVMQYIPDEIKDQIVDKFEEWSLGEWKESIIKIVDPVNFGDPTSSDLYTTYSIRRGKKSPSVFLQSGVSGDGGLEETIEKENRNIITLNPNDSLLKLLTDQYWILNSTPKIWYGIGDPKINPDNSDTGNYNNFYEEGFVVTKKQFETYLKSFFNSYKTNLATRLKELEDAKKDQSKSKNPTEDNDLKLALYRSFKSLNEKWLQRTPNGKDLFFNIAGSSDGVTCKNGAGTKTTLASHFVYVNRIWGDIGNKSVIDITKTNEIKDNKKMSLYQILGDILTDNEYLFFPLPTYINLTGSQGQTEEDLIKMFKPILTLEDASCGPLFVCMYVGGTSRRLDLSFGETNCARDNEDIVETLKNTRNDSFNIEDTNLPKDFQAGNFTAFKVLYGKQNQNHFKNIQLDQSEFTETAESLNVIDRLAQNQGSDRTTKGQSLMPAYLTRSYTCTIEAMGNMMIQPMTYFDLQGIPMFSGAYLITEVSHSVKPNNISTTFKGVRQPRTIVPIITSASATMNFSFTEESSVIGASLSSLTLGSTSSSSYIPGGKSLINVAPDLGIADNTTISKVLAIIRNEIEGGYAHPSMNLINSTDPVKQRSLDNSGETMFGHDRAAGNTELSKEGQEFWALIDQYSGFGMYGTGVLASAVVGAPGVNVSVSGGKLKAAPPPGASSPNTYSAHARQCYINDLTADLKKPEVCYDKSYIKYLRDSPDFVPGINAGPKKTKGGELPWKGSNDPNKTKWGHNYSPPETSPFGIKLRDLSVTVYIADTVSNFKKHFGGTYTVSGTYPDYKVVYNKDASNPIKKELLNRIFSDARLLLIFTRLTINGSGFFEGMSKDVISYYTSNTSATNDDLIRRLFNNQWNNWKGTHGSVTAIARLINWNETIPS